MKLIKNLDELRVGDWVKVFPKDLQKRYYKIGEITHKWLEGHKPCFQLKVIRTNLPYTTEELMKKMSVKMKLDYNKDDKIKYFKKDRVYRLNQEERTNLMKELILENLK